MSNTVYKIITDRIIEELRQGVTPWEKPWVNGHCPPRGYEMKPGKSYTGVNRFLLPFEGEYLTRKMVEKHHGRILDPHQSFIVTYLAKYGQRTETDEDGNETMTIGDEKRCLMYYRVYHISNTEGIAPRVKTRSDNADDMHPVDSAEAVVNRWLGDSGVLLRHTRGDSAGYNERTDTVTLPHMDQFANEESYYSVLFHELVHSTGHEARLCRDVQQAAYNGAGEARFTREELVAEIGSAFLMSRCGLDVTKVIRNTAARIQGWIDALSADCRMIVWAAAKAEKAVALILGESAQTEN